MRKWPQAWHSDFSKAFGCILHDTLGNKMQKDRPNDKCLIWWVLIDTQRMFINRLRPSEGVLGKKLTSEVTSLFTTTQLVREESGFEPSSA